MSRSTIFAALILCLPSFATIDFAIDCEIMNAKNNRATSKFALGKAFNGNAGFYRNVYMVCLEGCETPLTNTATLVAIEIVDSTNELAIQLGTGFDLGKIKNIFFNKKITATPNMELEISLPFQNNKLHCVDRSN